MSGQQSSRKPVAFALASGVCAVALWWLSGDWFGFFFTGIAVGAAILKRRFLLDKIGQLIVGLFWVAAVYGVYFVWLATDDAHARISLLGRAGTVFCLGLATTRLWMLRPMGNRVATAFIFLTSWLFLGIHLSRMTYLLFLVPGVIAIFAGGREGNTPASKKGRRKQWLSALMLLAIGGTLSSVFILGIPKMYAFLEARYLSRISMTTTGFSPVLELGGVGHMFVSNRIVLRAFTQSRRHRHLRGVVYNTYGGRYWTRSIDKRTHPAPDLTPGSDSIDIRLAEPESRLFAPRSVTGVMSEADIQMDSLGLLSVKGSDEVTRYRLSTGNPFRIRTVAPPLAADREIPASLQGPLIKWMRTHVPGDLAADKKLAVILAVLQNKYTYSLTFERPAGKDALLDFLTQNPTGHCEYFASAFALLARAAGVPSRVASGYLLKEYNRMGGYFIVRESHAHAWTEVWLNGQWVTMDPTPPAENAIQSFAVTNALDVAWVWLTKTKERLLDLNRYWLIAPIVLLLAVWGMIVLRRRLKTKAINGDILAYRDAHDVIKGIERAFINILPRKPSEPIEDWADRLRNHDESLRPMATLLKRYAAWRYGAVGDIDEIQAAFEALVTDPAPGSSPQSGEE